MNLGVLVSLNQKWSNVPILEAEITFGRSSENDVVIKSKMISNFHCKLVVQNEEIYVEDTSANGTFINTQKIGKGKKQMLTKGDELSLGIPSAEIAKDTKFAGEYASFIYNIENPKHAAFEEENGPQEKYECKEIIGTGAFAEVRLCIEKTTQKKFAIKIVDKKKFAMNKELRKGSFIDEVNILKRLNNPYIISVADIYETESFLCIILEYVSGGDLFDRIVKKKFYSEDDAKIVFKQMVLALDYLHDNKISHRDLKPENYLVVYKEDDLRIKLSDFGLSKVYGDESMMKTLCGTPQYLAPEVIEKARGLSDGYSFKVDVWSLGVILYILLVGYPPFPNGVMDVKHSKVEFDNARWKKVSQDAKDLIKNILKFKPDERPTCKQILDDVWLKDVVIPDDKEDKNEEEEDLNATKEQAKVENEETYPITPSDTQKRESSIAQTPVEETTPPPSPQKKNVQDPESSSKKVRFEIERVPTTIEKDNKKRPKRQQTGFVKKLDVDEEDEEEERQAKPNKKSKVSKKDESDEE